MSDKLAKTEAAPAALAPWEQQLAAEAKDEAAKEVTGVSRISHKGGVIKLDNKPVADNKLDMAVVDYGNAKAYYESDYDEGQAATPVCYAFGRDEKAMVPHDNAPQKQAATCAECPHNKFGTAERGRGKRCKDERRVMAFVGKNEVGDLAKAELRQLTVPPGSLKSWGTYLGSLRDVTPSGNVRTVLTQLGTTPLKGAYGLTFRATEKLDPEFVQALLTRREGVEPLMFAPYPNIEADERPKKSRNKKLD